MYMLFMTSQLENVEEKRTRVPDKKLKPSSNQSHSHALAGIHNPGSGEEHQAVCGMALDHSAIRACPRNHSFIQDYNIP